jgi:hypothetical protein
VVLAHCQSHDDESREHEGAEPRENIPEPGALAHHGPHQRDEVHARVEVRERLQAEAQGGDEVDGTDGEAATANQPLHQGGRYLTVVLIRHPHTALLHFIRGGVGKDDE